MGDPLLAIRDLHVTYATAGGALPAVRGVGLTVERGQIVGVAGESGCGKSTIASTVLRLQPANATVRGEVLLNGRDVLTMKWGELRAVRWAGASIVFQGALHSLNPVHRVGDQIAEPLHLHTPGLSDEAIARRVAELFEQVGLDPARARSYPHQLSGGQKQRIMIAMALACDPELVVADEPTTALDVMVQAQVLGVLSDLVRERGVGMMMISHDLSVLADVCDRITVMYAGRVVEEGAADTVFSKPLHPYSACAVGGLPARSATPPRGSHPRAFPAIHPTLATSRVGAPSRRGARAPRMSVWPPSPSSRRTPRGELLPACGSASPTRPRHERHERGAVSHRAPGRVLDPVRTGCEGAGRGRPAGPDR